MSKNSVAKNKYFQLINNLVKNDKVSHAYLIEVDNYEDDFLYVLDFIKLILCRNKNEIDKLNCGKCDICNQVSNNNYVDLKIIEPDGAVIKKKQLLDLQEEFQNKSFLDNKLIYIIKEADKLNDSSANTILKFLEEPEDDIIAILVTTNRYKIIETVLSRCIVISMQESSYSFKLDEKTLDLIKYITKKNELFTNYQYIYNDILPDKSIALDVLTSIEKAFISYLNYLSDNNFECDNNVIDLLSDVNSVCITSFIAIIEEELKKLEYNVNYKLWLDCLFAKLIGG